MIGDFVIYKNPSEIKDSMLFDKGTEIASFFPKNGDSKVSIAVAGDTLLYHNATAYHSASDFPEKVKEIIKSDSEWYLNPSISVLKNNHFEISYEEDGVGICSKIIDIEGFSVDEIRKEMISFAEYGEREAHTKYEYEYESAKEYGDD